MSKFKMFAVAMLMLAGVGVAGLQMSGASAPADYPSCGGCWPD